MLHIIRSAVETTLIRVFSNESLSLFQASHAVQTVFFESDPQAVFLSSLIDELSEDKKLWV